MANIIYPLVNLSTKKPLKETLLAETIMVQNLKFVKGGRLSKTSIRMIKQQTQKEMKKLKEKIDKIESLILNTEVEDCRIDDDENDGDEDDADEYEYESDVPGPSTQP